MRYKIFKDGEEINIIVADAEFVESYCAENGYTYEEDPLPEPDPVEPETEPDTELEDRVTSLEEAIATGLTLYEEDLSNG